MSLPKISQKSHGLTSHGSKATIDQNRSIGALLKQKIFLDKSGHLIDGLHSYGPTETNTIC
jgi:hypothetical protein